MNAAITAMPPAWLKQWFNVSRLANKEVGNELSERNFLFTCPGMGKKDFFGKLCISIVVFGFLLFSYMGCVGYLIQNKFSLPWACSVVFYAFIIASFVLCFIIYAADLIFYALLSVGIPLLSVYGIIQLTEFITFGQGDLIAKLAAFVATAFLAFICLSMMLMSIPGLYISILRTFRIDKDRQAHLLFLLSMAALALGLFLQNGGNWQQMASLNSPITIPGFAPIPFTASISFPFALLGWIENPAGAVLSSASAASTNVILALFASAAALFFFAANRIQLSAVGVRPEFALLAFALFWVSVLFDVALHWHSAPVLPPALVLFNRAFAVLALVVSLFWRNAAKRGKDVPGADGEYIKACDAAEQTARKIGLWLLGLVWLATQLSHANLSPVAFYWVKFVMISAFIAIPLRLMIQFKLDFQKALGRYNQLLDLWQQSYKAPSTVATDAQVRDALNGGRGIGGKDWNDTGE